MTIKLPPLPEPTGAVDIDCGQAPGGGREILCVDGFTEAQMQAYALAAIEAYKQQQQPPLSEAEIMTEFDREPEQFGLFAFESGVRYAEKHHGIGGEKLYASPAPAQQPLTDEQIATACAKVKCVHPDAMTTRDIARAIERAHGIGGEK